MVARKTASYWFEGGRQKDCFWFDYAAVATETKSRNDLLVRGVQEVVHEVVLWSR